MKKYSLIMKGSFRRNSSINTTKLAVGVCVAAIILGWLVPAVTHVIGSVVMQPVMLVERWLRTSETAIPIYIRDRAVLLEQVQDLSQKVAMQSVIEAERAAAVAENNTLRNLLSTDTAALASSTVVANVLLAPPYVPYDRLVLNRGSNDGVAKDSFVYAGERVVIGSVIETTPSQSVVELVSSPGREITVYVFGPDIYTTAVGQGGGVLKVGVPQGVPIAIGDPVTLPAGSQNVIGTIEYIDTAPARPEQFAYVPLPISLPALQTVLVGTIPQSPISFAAAREHVATTRTNIFAVPVPEGVLVDITVASSTDTGETATTSEM